jgi:hypothetical protein
VGFVLLLAMAGNTAFVKLPAQINKYRYGDQRSLHQQQIDPSLKMTSFAVR